LLILEEDKLFLQKLYTSPTPPMPAPGDHNRCMNFINNKLKLIIALIAVMATAGLVANGQSSDTGTEIRMTAKKYDFTPDTITVKKGDQVRLVITALDHDHGFKIEAFHINRKLPKGEPVFVEFTADQSGIFPFECSQFCGLGHKKMRGKLVVE
jgi:cytochrome c oxidase subunit II